MKLHFIFVFSVGDQEIRHYYKLLTSRSRDVRCAVPRRGLSPKPTITVVVGGTETITISHSASYLPPSITSISPLTYPGVGTTVFTLTGKFAIVLQLIRTLFRLTILSPSHVLPSLSQSMSSATCLFPFLSHPPHHTLTSKLIFTF